MPYSTPALRYSLRMRPFLSISLPEVPSFSEFESLISLRSPDNNVMQSTESRSTHPVDVDQPASSILEVADQTLKVARKEWEAVSKTRSETAHCVGCEDWWKTSVRNTLRSCIAANIMVANAKKIMAHTGSKSVKDAHSVDIQESSKCYHSWWIIPRIMSK